MLGRQWMWQLDHPGGKREINELHVPVGRPVRLTMTSQDVIHSFYIPAFRTKQDVMPGALHVALVRADQAGPISPVLRRVLRDEALGDDRVGGGDGAGRISAVARGGDDRGVDVGRRRAAVPAAGLQRLPRRQRDRAGALLDGVYGHPVPLETGRFVQADERYIRDSILLPASEVAAGYKPVMPTFQGHISEDELLKIIAYIKAIGKNERVER